MRIEKTPPHKLTVYDWPFTLRVGEAGNKSKPQISFLIQADNSSENY